MFTPVMAPCQLKRKTVVELQSLQIFKTKTHFAYYAGHLHSQAKLKFIMAL